MRRLAAVAAAVAIGDVGGFTFAPPFGSGLGSLAVTHAPRHTKARSRWAAAPVTTKMSMMAEGRGSESSVGKSGGGKSGGGVQKRRRPQKTKVMQLYKDAQHKLRNGQTDAAIKLLEQCLHMDPNDGHSWLALARAEARRGNIVEAKNLFDRSTTACPENVHLWQAWAVFDHKSGDFEAARYHFGKAAEVDARNPYVCHAWGLMEAKAGNIEEARALFLRALEAGPQAQVSVALAELEAQTGDFDAARLALSEGAEASLKTQKVESAPLFIAWARLEEKNFGRSDLAFDILHKAVGHCPDEVNLHIALAQLELRMGRVTSARNILSKAAEQPISQSRRGGALYNAWVNLEQKVVQDEPRALALVREGIEKFPAEQSLYQTLGTLLDRKGDYEGAVAAFRESIRIHPTGAAFVAWALMEERHKSTKATSPSAASVLSAERKSVEEARRLFERGIRSDPTHGPLYNAYGAMELRHRNADAARQVFERGIAGNCSGMVHVWHGLGTLELRLGNIEEANAVFRSGIERADMGANIEDTSFLLHSLGTLELQSQRPAEACAVFSEGIKRYPNNSHLLLGAALTEHKLNEIESARTFFRRAVRADRKHAHAWQAWGVLEAREGQIKAARTLYESGLKECEDHAALWQAYGMLEVQVEATDRARALFKAGVERCPENVHLLQAWAVLEVRTGSYLKAKELIESAVVKDPSHGPSWTAYAVIEERQNNIDRARRIFEAGIKNAPYHGPLYRSYAEMEAGQGHYEQARELFEKGIDNDPFHAQLFHAYAEMEARLVNMPALQKLDARARELFSEDVAVRQAQRILAEKHRRWAQNSLQAIRGVGSTSYDFDTLGSVELVGSTSSLLGDDQEDSHGLGML